MAIISAFNSPEVAVLGLTTIFGNVPTAMATRNALYLTHLAGRSDVPVVPGASFSLRGVEKSRVADFVHGVDGFGNTNIEHPEARLFRAFLKIDVVFDKTNTRGASCGPQQRHAFTPPPVLRPAPVRPCRTSPRLPSRRLSSSVAWRERTPGRSCCWRWAP